MRPVPLSWAIALAVLPFVLWRGGLLGWQSVLVPGAFAAIIALGPGVSLGRLTGFLALFMIGLTANAVAPQTHLNSAMTLLAGIFTLGALRSSEAEPALPLSATLFFACAAALAFFVIGIGLGRTVADGATVGGLASPHLSARPFFPNQNLLAAALLAPGFLAAIVLSGSARRYSLWALLCGAALIYAGGKGAFLGLFAGLAWVALSSWRGRLGASALGKRAGMAALLIVLGIFLLPFSRLSQRVWLRLMPPASQDRFVANSDVNEGRRIDFWRASLMLSAEKPFLGWGLNNFPVAARYADMPTPLTARQPIARYRLRLEHAHSEPLEWAVELGWPLAVMLGALILAALRWRWQQPVDLGRLALEAMLVSLLVFSLFDMPFRSPAVLCLAGLWAIPLLPCFQPGKTKKSALAVAAVALILSAGALTKNYWLQSLDGKLAAQRLSQGQLVMAWSAWAAREEPSWWKARSGQWALKGEFEAALAATARAAELQPYQAMDQLQLAQQAKALKKDAWAEEALAKALSLEPNFAQAWELKARWTTNPSERKKALKKLLEIEPLRVAVEEADAYTLALKKADWAWIHSEVKK